MASLQAAQGAALIAAAARPGLALDVASTPASPFVYDLVERHDGAVPVAPPPKESREFGGRAYVLEHGITTDFALVRAWRGDRHGNLVFRRAAANFNPLAAMAGRVTVAEVEELVEPGELAPDMVHLPGVFVQRIVELTPAQAADKHIEKRTVRS